LRLQICPNLTANPDPKGISSCSIGINAATWSSFPCASGADDQIADEIASAKVQIFAAF
jgi:hypothetical protein